LDSRLTPGADSTKITTRGTTGPACPADKSCMGGLACTAEPAARRVQDFEGWAPCLHTHSMTWKFSYSMLSNFLLFLVVETPVEYTVLTPGDYFQPSLTFHY